MPNSIYLGDGANPFDQDLNTTDAVTFAGATLSDPVTETDQATTKEYVDLALATVNTGGAAQSSFVASGGQVIWQSDLIFLVSACTYFINGVLFESTQQSITLSAADASNPRLDVIAVDDTGTVVKVTGTAAASPSEPSIDLGTQLKLALVSVPANATEPVVTSILLYADNAGSPTEWDWTTSGSGFNVNSSNNPRQGTKTIEGTAVAAAAYAQGQIGSGSFDPNSADFLIIYIASKATWTNKRGLQVSLRSSGVLVGLSVAIQRSGSFGFDSSILTYQQVAIPISQFAVPVGTLINQVRIADFGGSIGFYLDDISFLSGSGEQFPQGITQEQADARYLRKPIIVPVPFLIDGGGSAITTGIKGDLYFPYACTITGVVCLADQSGSIVVDLWVDTYTNYPPTDADSITASAPPTISTATKSTDTTLTGWTTAIAAGSTLRYNVDSITTLTRVTVTLITERVA